MPDVCVRVDQTRQKRSSTEVDGECSLGRRFVALRQPRDPAGLDEHRDALPHCRPGTVEEAGIAQPKPLLGRGWIGEEGGQAGRHDRGS
jgi:hypothetical protein